MTPPKSADRTSSRSSTASRAPETPAPSTQPPAQSQRKPWKKKSPVEIFMGQIERLREDVARKEQEFNQAKRQLQKLEEAIKLLESA